MIDYISMKSTKFLFILITCYIACISAVSAQSKPGFYGANMDFSEESMMIGNNNFAYQDLEASVAWLLKDLGLENPWVEPKRVARFFGIDNTEIDKMKPLDRFKWFFNTQYFNPKTKLIQKELVVLLSPYLKNQDIENLVAYSFLNMEDGQEKEAVRVQLIIALVSLGKLKQAEFFKKQINWDLATPDKNTQQYYKDQINGEYVTYYLRVENLEKSRAYYRDIVQDINKLLFFDEYAALVYLKEGKQFVLDEFNLLFKDKPVDEKMIFMADLIPNILDEGIDIDFSWVNEYLKGFPEALDVFNKEIIEYYLNKNQFVKATEYLNKLISPERKKIFEAKILSKIYLDGTEEDQLLFFENN